MYGDSYIRKIRAEGEARRAQRAAESAAVVVDSRAALRAEIAEWQIRLQLEGRQRAYLLEDIRQVIRATPQQLGVALDELGWRRKRVWLPNGPFRRYWFPPDQ